MGAFLLVSLQVVFLGLWKCRRAVVEPAGDPNSLKIVSVFVSLHVSALGHGYPADIAFVWLLTLPPTATCFLDPLSSRSVLLSDFLTRWHPPRLGRSGLAAVAAHQR